ncbi:GNAT family N-acetyltransferase [Paenibacillus sp. VCA1]|uniref:GNAT family N-acetyltransferase n=1 Tax=Paenibacillus sp. VCA1 TaxID=3039148 RepID=UPI002871840F|nr:GNAT family N-acetyltransferase [Paenibacillus sp. VCA1]MDR9854463.1 GNAT family N-acetyltransferase [Paenibacillus sp. VCA1]
MDKKERLKHLHHLDLGEGFCLRRAEAAEWETYAGVYYHQATVGFYRNGNGAGGLLPAGDEPFWLQRDEAVQGGLALSAGAFRHLFALPPFRTDAELIRRIAQALRRVGGPGQPLRAWDVPDDGAEAYIRAGFRPDPCRFRWMQRPAAEFADMLPDPLAWRPVEVLRDSAGARMALEREAGLLLFKHAPEAGRLELTPPSFAQTLHRLREWAARSSKAGLDASSLVYDGATRALIGVCLIGYAEGCPTIDGLAVLPTFRGRGVATRMLGRAMTVLARNGERLFRIRIMHGHPIESLCYRLGFMPGPLFMPEMTFVRS